ncbi:MAG: PorV/PorQ family protein [Bacteroidales bacterium]|nr:PorV/PorQ family protein [Bacteroidales bacterium]
MKRLTTIALLAFASITLNAQTAKYSNDFLNIGVGARWLAMGNTGVALSSNIESAYWNPSGLAGMDKSFEVGAMHASYFAGMASYNHIGLAHKLDSSSAIAFTAIRFGVDDIPNTTDLIDSDGNFSYDRLKMFSVADYAFLLSYARKLPIEGLSIGANAKVIYRNVGKFASAWGFGIDLAAKYKFNNWILGANFRDITTTLNIWSFNSDELEITIGDSTFNQAPDNNLEITTPQLSVGIARTFSITNDIALSAEFGGNFHFDGQRNTPLTTSFASIEPRLGIEASYLNLVFIRAGVNNLQRVNDFGNKTSLIIQPNIGLGLSFRGVSIDYALTNVGNVGFSRYSNIFSLRWEFKSFKRTS